MKKLLSILSITAIICSLSLSQAIAMEAKSGDMKSDKTMMDNGMKKDGAMGKDHKMMDDGMLEPDEDISTYLGYAVGNPRYPDTPITLRMLMSHTAGLNENSSYSSKSSKLSNMIALDQKARANFKDVRPGSEYAYSNFGAGITGAIIESVTGEDVSSFMREYLFEPLGIDAAYTATQLEEPEYLTATYHKDGSLYIAPSYALRQTYDAQATPDAEFLQLRPPAGEGTTADD